MRTDKGVFKALLGMAMLIALVFCWNRGMRAEEKAGDMQRVLAGEVFRFHVRANSNSRRDQEVKLAVRDRVLEYMKAEIGESASEEETESWSRSNQRELRRVAESVLEKEGLTYGAKVSVGKSYFPDKRYGEVFFPAGEYRSLIIELGSAEGKNWWCVLYPGLCFMDSTCAVVDDEGKEKLREVLDEERYDFVTSPTKFKIKWYFLGD